MSDRQEARRKAYNVETGDRVRMAVQLHGRADDHDGVRYDDDLHSCVVRGVVVDTPRDGIKDMMRDGTRVMADFVVQGPDGKRFTWHADNGYVTTAGTPADIGHFGGFYTPE